MTKGKKQRVQVQGVYYDNQMEASVAAVMPLRLERIPSRNKPPVAVGVWEVIMNPDWKIVGKKKTIYVELKGGRADELWVRNIKVLSSQDPVFISNLRILVRFPNRTLPRRTSLTFGKFLTKYGVEWASLPMLNGNTLDENTLKAILDEWAFEADNGYKRLEKDG